MSIIVNEQFLHAVSYANYEHMDKLICDYRAGKNEISCKVGDILIQLNIYAQRLGNKYYCTNNNQADSHRSNSESHQLIGAKQKYISCADFALASIGAGNKLDCILHFPSNISFTAAEKQRIEALVQMHKQNTMYHSVGHTVIETVFTQSHNKLDEMDIKNPHSSRLPRIDLSSFYQFREQQRQFEVIMPQLDAEYELRSHSAGWPLLNSFCTHYTYFKKAYRQSSLAVKRMQLYIEDPEFYRLIRKSNIMDTILSANMPQ